MAETPIAADYAAFLARLDTEMLPSHVRADARWRFVDTVGVAIGGTRLDFAPALLGAAAALGGRAECTVLGTTLRLPAAGTGFANGALAHGADFDDTHTGAIVHVSAVVIPVALAVGERTGADGAACATAAVGGGEIGLRVARPLGLRLQRRGFHPTSVCGPFAAAATAAKLLGLAPDQTVAALGLASSHAGGLLQGVIEGTWAKRLHPGWAAQAGIACALLAQQGMTGPAWVLEGEAGLYRALLGDEDAVDIELAREGLGESWLYPDAVFKPFPSAAWTHASLAGFDRLCVDAGLDADAIAHVVCTLPTAGHDIVCHPARAHAPATPYHMKNSLPYVLAMRAVLGGVDPLAFTEATLADPGVRAFAERVTGAADPDRGTDGLPAHVAVRTTDGRTLKIDVPAQRGSSANPMSPEEHRAKFLANATSKLTAAGAATALDRLERIWELRDIATLTASITEQGEGTPW